MQYLPYYKFYCRCILTLCFFQFDLSLKILLSFYSQDHKINYSIRIASENSFGTSIPDTPSPTFTLMCDQHILNQLVKFP